MPPLAIAIGVAGLASAGAGIFGATQAHSAADEQVAAQEKALEFQQQVYGEQKQNIAPFVSAGQTSIGQLMQALQQGTFGPGSIPNFTAPTVEQAKQSPGYQFTQEQGNKGILEGAAAAGGAISGGTIKALDTFNTGLANSTYNDVFTRGLQTYQQQLGTQAQAFQQLATPAALGLNAIGSINNSGSATALNVGNLMSSIGSSQAAGTVGAANSLNSGISGLGNSALSYGLLSKLFGGGATPPIDLTSGVQGVNPFAGYLAEQGVGPG